MLKNILILAGFSTFAVALIVGLNIYHGQVESTIEPINEKGITPITPSFDTATLEQLKERVPIAVDLGQSSGVITQDTVTEEPEEEEGNRPTPASGSALAVPTLLPTQNP